MFLSAIKEIYTESGKQFLASWMKLLAWNGIWALFCVIGVLIFSNRIVQMMMGVNTDPGSVALFVFIIILISAIVWGFGFYSQLGIAHETEQDPDCSWGLCGIQGILHPRKSLGISVVSLVLSFIFTLGVTGLAFLLPVMGGVVIIFYILLFAGWAFLLMFVSMACFAQLENDESAPLASFQRAMDILKGHALKTFAFIVPVFLVCMLLLGSCASLWVGSQSGKLFDLQLAMDARQVVAAEQAKTDMERKYSIFNKKAPIYEGDFDKYVHEMAKYTVLYEEYQAKIEKRQM
ncbi:MAG: hypothetical protein IJU23_10730, partial [Proteobacteria bacterium]|nr:hypothetical protein [Pseudomonadota bacterium]